MPNMQLSPSAAVPAPLTKLWIWHAGKSYANKENIILSRLSYLQDCASISVPAAEWQEESFLVQESELVFQ